MLYRKIQDRIEEHLSSDSDKILIIDGARQIGKSYIIRHVAGKMYENYIEINFEEDYEGARAFENVHSVEDFYFQISMLAGDRMDKKENTIIFLDEIQRYPHFFTLLKFLRQDDRFTYIASGSLLGVTLKKTSSIPVGSIEIMQMFPLDFEEFLIASGFSKNAIETMYERFKNQESLDENTHLKILDLFRKYLLVGGLPDAVKSFLAENNIVKVRKIQEDIRMLYLEDASKYESEFSRKLQIRRIYQMIPANMGRIKKRVVVKEIENKKGKRYSEYTEEFEYLIASGIALETKAVSTPTFPLIESTEKNLLKLYMNDVGLLTNVLYNNNIRAVLDNEKSVNLGAVYETVVAQELKAHGFKLYYYDNKSKGEVDFLIDDYDSLSTLPVEVKSGRDYSVHSALNHFIANGGYPVKRGIVFSNEREIVQKGDILYMPVYDVMFFS